MMVNGNVAAWLYGSHSRGDADEFSDFDVLVVSDRETDDVPLHQILAHCASPSVSRYTWREIDEMVGYGSLFMRHLDLEGRPIYESVSSKGRLKRSLSNLGPYKRARRDIEGFRAVLGDIAESLESRGASLFYELSTLGTVFRHAAILGCAVSGDPCFSRHEPVAKLVGRWQLPKCWGTEFHAIYAFRMYSENRALEVTEPSSELADLWCARAHKLLDELGRRIREAC